MARKDKLKTDDFDLDSGLNDFDFNFDLDSELDQEAKQPKKRSTIGSVFKGALTGIKDTATSPSFIKQTLERSLPDSYGEVASAAGEVTTGMYELYDETVKEVKPRLGRISKKLDQLVPDSAPRLKKLSEKLMDLTGAERETEYNALPSQEDQAVTTALAAIFEQNRQYTQDNSKQQLLRETIDAKRFDQSSSLLSTISRNTAIQTQYTTNVTQAYQKKMLELSLRSYLGQREHFKYTEKYLEGFRMQHEAIIKNTSLPDYAKITNWERIKDEGKRRMSSKLYGEGSFIQRGMQRLKDSAQEFVSGLTMPMDNLDFALDSALSGKETIDQMNEMMIEMGEEPLSKAEMAGATASAEGMAWLRDKVAERLKKRAAKNPKIVNSLAKMANVALNPAGAIQTLRESDKWDTGINDYQTNKGKLYRFADYILSHFEDDEPSREHKAGIDLDDLNKPTKGFDVKAHITLVDVIPGHLSAIHREIAMMRLGREDIPSRVFDFSKKEFVDNKEMTKRLHADLKKDIKSSGHDYYLSRAAKDFAGDDKMSDDQELELKRFLGRLARIPNFKLEPENIRNTQAYDNLHPSIQALVDKKLDAMENAEDKETRKTDMTRHVRNVRKNMPSLDKSMKKYVDAGYGSQLESTGLVKRNDEGHYEVDEEQYASYLERNGLIRSDVNVKESIKKLNPAELLQTVADRFKGKQPEQQKLDWRGSTISPLKPDTALDKIKDSLTSAKHVVKDKLADLKERAANHLDPENQTGKKKWSPEGAFNAFKKTKLYNWMYQKGKGDQQPHSGPMAQEVNKNFGEEAAPGGKAIDLQSMNGAAMAAIKYLGEKVDWMKKTWIDRSKDDTKDKAKPTKTTAREPKGKDSSSLLAKIEQNTRGLLVLNQKAMAGLTGGRGKGRRQRGGAIGPQYQAGFVGFQGDGYGSIVGNLAKGVTDLGLKIGQDSFTAVEKIFGFGKDKVVLPFAKFMSEKWKNNKDDLQKGFGKLVDKALDVGGTILDFGKRLVDTHLPAGFREVKQFGQKVLGKLTEKFYEARDLYLPDGPEPILRAVKMRAGEYYDRASGQVVKTLEDLNKAKGDIVDKAGNIILSVEERAKGLYDAHGNKIKSFFSAAVGAVFGAGAWVKNKIMAGVDWMKTGPSVFDGMFDGLKNFFGNATGGLSEWMTIGRESHQVLVDIRSILLGDEAEVRKRLKMEADKAAEKAKAAADKAAAKEAAAAKSEITEQKEGGKETTPAAAAAVPATTGTVSSGGLIGRGLEAGKGFFNKHFAKDENGQRPTLKQKFNELRNNDKVKEKVEKFKGSRFGKLAQSGLEKVKESKLSQAAATKLETLKAKPLAQQAMGLKKKLFDRLGLTPQEPNYRNRIGQVASVPVVTQKGSDIYGALSNHAALATSPASSAYSQSFQPHPANYTSVGGAASAPLVYSHVLAEGSVNGTPAQMGAAATVTQPGHDAEPAKSSLRDKLKAKVEQIKAQPWKEKLQKAKEAVKQKLTTPPEPTTENQTETPKTSLKDKAKEGLSKLKDSKLGKGISSKIEALKARAQPERVEPTIRPDYRAQTPAITAPTTSTLPTASGRGILPVTTASTGYGQSMQPHPANFTTVPGAASAPVAPMAQRTVPVTAPVVTAAAAVPKPGLLGKVGGLLGKGKGLVGKAGGLLGGAVSLAGGLLGGGEPAAKHDNTNDAERARDLGEHARPTIVQRIKQKLAPKDRAWNDKDGDGERDGSVQAQKEHQEDLKASRNKDAAQADLSIRYNNGGDLLGDLKSKLGSIFSLVTGGLSGMFSLAGNLLGMVPGAAKLLGKGVGLAGKVLGPVASLAQTGLGKVLPGAIRMGAGMYARAVGFSLFTALPSVVGAGMSLAGSALAGIASAVAAPVLIGALAIGAGYGIWKLYKYATRDSANDMEKLRLRQYGFAFNSEVHRYNHHVYGLEAYLQDGRVGYDHGQAYIIDRKCKPEEMAELFDIDKDDKETADNFAYWFEHRFKPFFLTHLSALYAVDPKCDLNKTDGLDDDKKLKYLQASPYSDGPYDVKVSPLKAISELSTDKEVVVNAVKGMISRLQDNLTKKGKKVELPKREPGNAPAPTDKDAKSTQAPMDAALKEAQSKDSKTGGVDALKQSLVEKEDNSQAASGSPLDQSNTKSPSAVPMAAGDPLSGSGGSKFVKLAQGVDINGLDPKVLQFFMGMAEEYGQMTGNSILVKSGRRSTEKQAALHAADPKKAAPPGHSLHEFGLALDIDDKDADKLEKLGLMKKYGFTRPIGGEPWHIEPAGIQKNIQLAKTDQRQRAVMLDASLFRGGGGLGTDPSAPKYKRDTALAVKLLDLPPTPAEMAAKDQKKDIITPGQALQASDDKSKGSAPDTKVAVSTPTGSAQSTGGSDLKPKAANDTSFAKSSAASNTNALPASPESEGKPSASGGMTMTMTEGGKAGDVKAIITEGAKKVGVDPGLMVAFAAMESELNPNAKAPGGSAAGLFQFMPATWQEQLSKFGSKYGLDSNATPFDPKAATVLAGEYVKYNKRVLAPVNSNPGPVEMYLAHMLGAGGAKSFLQAGKEEIGARFFPGPAKANKSIFYSPSGKALTIGEIYAGIESRMTERAGRYGVNVSKSGLGLKPGGGQTGITPSATPSAGVPSTDSGSKPDLSSSGPQKDTKGKTTASSKAADATLSAPSSTDSGGKGLFLPQAAPVRQESGQAFSGPSQSDLAPILDKSYESLKSMDTTLKLILENVKTEKVAEVLSSALATIMKTAKKDEEPTRKEQDNINMGRVSKMQPSSLDLSRKTV